MQSEESGQGSRQRLGRRLGLRPYYAIAERTPVRLRLESRPEANRTVGRRLMIVGALLLGLGALVAVSGLYAAASGAGFAVAALGAVVGGLLSAVGYQRALGGYVVATTRNSVVVDATQQTLRFTQGNRVAPERSQTLPFAAVQAMRLRRRAYVAGGLIRRPQPVVALELLASVDEPWIVDSAADPEQLRPLVEGLGAILGVELARE